MASRTSRAPVANCCNTTRVNSCCGSTDGGSNRCRANTLQYKPFTKTFYSEKLGWQTKVGSWNYPAWAVRYLPPARQRTRCCKKC